MLGAHHVLHVGSRRVDLTPQFVVQVQDEVHVSLADGPPPSRLGPPPLLIFVCILVQDGLEPGGVGEGQGLDGRVQAKEQDRYSQQARENNRPPHDGEKTDAARNTAGQTVQVISLPQTVRAKPEGSIKMFVLALISQLLLITFLYLLMGFPLLKSYSTTACANIPKRKKY